MLPLAAGSRLGPFEILAPLGAGGMGEVYRARDPRLGREVALKVLPAAVSGDADRLRRFEQEARAASALNHPNVLTVFDTGSQDGVSYLVTELLEGETLRERLGGGALPARKAVEIAIQAARGLAAAHERGIVHRDLKPENLFLTRDGRLKILDFGLAKLQTQGAGSASELAAAPTALGGTEPGVVLGTVGYMAPEQVRGLPADPRADLFALGAILYEMLAGRRAFQRDSAAETMTAILREEPPELVASGRAIPPGLDAVVHHCLEKAREERFQSARDLAFALERLSGSSSGRSGSPPTPSVRRLGPRQAGLFAGAVALLAAIYLAGRAGGVKRTDAGEPVHFSRLTRDAEVEFGPALAPNGDSIAYSAGAGFEADIYLRRVGGENAVDLTPNSPGLDTDPAFSPDGRSIAFHSEREGGGLFLMGATGESVRRLTDKGESPAWSPDGREIAFAERATSAPGFKSGPDSRLLAFEVATRATRVLVEGQDAVRPSWSPHGNRIAFWGVRAGGGQCDVWTLPAAGARKPTDLVPVTADSALDWNPFWSPDGRWLYFLSDRDGTSNLWRVPIAEDSGRVLGAPEPSRLPSGDVHFATGGRDGSIVYGVVDLRSVVDRYPFDAASGRIAGPAKTLWVGRPIGSLDVSSDGQGIVLGAADMPEDLVLLRADGKVLRQLTDDPARDGNPRWAPDGSSIAFHSDRDGAWRIWTVRPDGGGLRRFSPAVEPMLAPLWARDGRSLWAFNLSLSAPSGFLVRPGAARIERLPPVGPGLLFLAGDWSADGRWLAGPLLDVKRGLWRDLALYDFTTQRFTVLPTPKTEGVRWRTLAFVPNSGRMRWLDGSPRLLASDGGRLYLLDGERKTSTALLDLAPAQLTDFALSADQRWLLVTYVRAAGDLWRREPPSAAAPARNGGP